MNKIYEKRDEIFSVILLMNPLVFVFLFSFFLGVGLRVICDEYLKRDREGKE